MNKEFNGFDEMVEALEENEDMVECKECFDLFPKAECERSEVGYVCPTCRGLRTAPALTRFVDPYDCYTQDFPEVKDYNPDAVVEYEKEPGLGDALTDLIRDEYEAIDGYEVADEKIQHAAIDADQKDEILDTLDHIKEEEEEHIDELKDLCPECDPEAEPEKLEEAAEEEEVEEIPEEAIPEEETEEEAEDSEENENEEVSDLDSAYEVALAIANESGVGQVFGYARKDTEEFVAVEPFEVDDPEAVEDDLMAVYDDVAYAYVAYPEKELSEALFENVQLHEGPGRFLKGIGQRIGNAAKNLVNRDSGKLMDKFFNNGYIIVVEGPKPSKEVLNKFNALNKKVLNTVEAALNDAYHGSQDFPTHKVWVFAKPIDTSDLTPREYNLAKASNGLGPVIACFSNGRAVEKHDKEIADTIQKIEIDKKDREKVTGSSGSTGRDSRDPRDFLGDEDATDDTSDDTPDDTSDDKPVDELNLDDDEDLVTKLLGDKVDPADYTPESYKRYEAAYAKIVEWIKNSNPKAITSERVNAYKEQAEAKLQKVKKAPEDEDDGPNLDDDDDAVDPKEKAKQMLGEKKAADGYTPESYKKYEAAYAKILAWIEAHPKPESLTQERIDNLKAQAEAKLQEVEDADPNLDDDDEEPSDTEQPEDVIEIEGSDIEAAALEALDLLGEKKDPEKYTEESYKIYSENFDKMEQAIRDAKSVEDIEKLNLEDNIKANEAILKEKPAETSTEDVTDSSEGEAEETSEETPEEDTKSNNNKLVVDELSDQALLKLYFKVTGNPTPADPAKRAALLKKIRNGLKSSDLGEGFNPDLGEDDLIEALQSEADAVKSLKATAASLKDTANSMQNMTQAMHEEYHKYANPTELKAMEDIEELITKALTKVYADITTWGYEAEEVDSQSFMCQEDEACLQYMVNFQDLDPEEFEDLADQIQMQLENEVSVYKPVPEIRGVSVSVALPDYDLADTDDADEGITKASFLFYVAFARNLY